MGRRGEKKEKEPGFRPVNNLHILGFLGVVLVALSVSAFVRTAEEVFGFGGKFEAKNDENCQLLKSAEGPFGSEDFAEYKDGLFFVSAGDLGPSFGAIRDRGTREGKMWILDGKASQKDPMNKKMKVVPIDGLPPRSKIKFQPHGLFYSEKSNTLYAISHGGLTGGEKVFTFTPSQKVGKNDVNSVKLTFERAMSTKEYTTRYGLFNDIVEGTKKGEYYMTQMLPNPLPLNGHPETAGEFINHFLNYLSIFTSGSTFVHRCTFDAQKKTADNEDVFCEIVATGFAMANGITTNEARNTYWVVDGRRVSEMKREVDGKLTKKDTFSIPHMGDNIEWTKNGDLLVGTLVNPLEALKNMGTGVPSEGSLHVIHQENNKMSYSEDLVFHKGNQLESISAGARYENKAFLGSPFHTGVLFCEL